jgi:hypothetical protein
VVLLKKLLVEYKDKALALVLDNAEGRGKLRLPNKSFPKNFIPA